MANRYVDAPRPVYERLLELVREKDYFVITTNVDHCFQKAGFEKQRLFYTQGDYGLFQCSKPCCQKTYDNEASIRQMAYRRQDAAYACVNLNEAYAPEEIATKSICISADLGMVFDQIRSRKN